ncbi:hypothetical protein Cni_G27572 [Canna indica]|uniref:Uncharacterized protein n=1 Tax=Canna indica TaxID=4628 RepID=A0AAQ3L1N5_9LILI|nr:hypothetical protein Cni_G27572 [Canna indica]
MAAKKGFEDFEAVFGDATAEWDPATASNAAGSFCPFLFYVHAPDPSRLEVIATDFHSFTFARVLTVDDLEDLRDDIGIGGSWSEFVDYLKSSLSAGDVKLFLGGLQNVDSGNGCANLIALKSKGLPRISLALNKVLDVPAKDSMAKLSLALYRAFKKKHSDSLQEQERSSRLMESLSSEREKNDILQKQLDSLSFLSKRKAPMPKSSEVINSQKTLGSQLQQPLEVAAIKVSQATKTSQRGSPVPRRLRVRGVRGVSLQDTEDNDDS